MHLDVDLTNRLVDIIQEGYDLALRSAKLESSNLIAQKIYEYKNVICATPNYFKRHGIPKSPGDLSNHNCATYNLFKGVQRIKFEKSRNYEFTYLKGNFSSNHLELIKEILLNDFCLGVIPKFMVTQELKQQMLHLCLEEYPLEANGIYAIYPEREFVQPKLRYFLDMLKDYLG